MKRFKNICFCLFVFSSLNSMVVNAADGEELKPLFIIGFEEGGARVNNKFVIKDRLKAMPSGNMPVIVGAGESEDDYLLAVERLRELKPLFGQNVKLVMKSPNVAIDKNALSIYSVRVWDKKSKAAVLGGDYVEIEGMSGFYSADEKRWLLSAVLKKRITPKGKDAAEKVGSILDAIGWKLELDGIKDLKSKYDVPSVDVVLLGEVATVNEVNELMGIFIKQLFPSYRFDLDDKEKKILVRLM